MSEKSTKESIRALTHFFTLQEKVQGNEPLLCPMPSWMLKRGLDEGIFGEDLMFEGFQLAPMDSVDSDE